MEHIEVSKPGGPGSGFHVEGFPEAVKVVGLKGANAKRIAHLVLHFGDLSFAEACLGTLATGQVEPIRSALWNAAVIHYMKCFGQSKARFRLHPDAIYSGNTIALEAFKFFKDMRNKHIVHDENAFSQALPGAIINRQNSSYKIAKIVTFSARADILGQENFTNLRLLIEGAKAWVIQEYDNLCDLLTKELEGKSHQELLALSDMVYSKPEVKDVSTTRPQG